MISRRLASEVVAAGWVLVSLLPWWQLRVEFSNQSGAGTKIISADVWRASTPAALAIVAAAVVSIVLVATRGRLPRTREQRGIGLAIACLPVFLLGWAAWSILWRTTAPKEHRAFITSWTIMSPSDLQQPFDGYQIVHDRLQIQTLPRSAEGPAWGLYVGVALVLVVTAWALVRLLRSPKPE